jgi:putative transposase
MLVSLRNGRPTRRMHQASLRSYLHLTLVLARHRHSALILRVLRRSLESGQFTSTDFVSRLQAEEIEISWSGRKRCYDNILVERLWRTVKYEEVYLHAHSDGWEAEISLARFLLRYCHVRPHSSLGGKTPYEAYTETEPCFSRPVLKILGARAFQ